MSRAGDASSAETLSKPRLVERMSGRRMILTGRDIALWLFPIAPAGLIGAFALRSADALVIALSAGLLLLAAAIACIDARRMIIPDGLTAALALLGLGTIFIVDSGPLVSRLMAAGVTMLGLQTFREAFRHWRGHEGMGFGDVKLAGAAALWIGPEGLPSLILLAAMTALATAMCLRLARGRLRRLPFGPHLAAALWLVWCWGPLGPA